MDKLKAEYFYSISEASKLIGINRKRIQRRAVKQGLKKQGRGFVLTGEWLIREFKKEVQDIVSNDDEKVSENVQERLIGVSNDTPQKTHTRQIRELEYRIQELEQELLIYNVAPNERLEVFTNEEYDIFRQRLIEWTTQQEQITKQTENFDKEKASLQELIVHYQNQADYQREQANKILDIHQKLVDTIQQQNALAIQRNVIEAKDKGVIDDEWDIQ